MSEQMGFYFNSAVCTGCRACQMACKDKNDLAIGDLFRRVYSYEGGTWEKTEIGYAAKDLYNYAVSISCNHCAKPACVEVCPSGAMTKDEVTGIVSNDQSVCIGCKSCGTACPYEAPRFLEALGVTGKCDFCADLLEKGERPACVAICPMRALDYGPLAELEAKYGAGNVEIEPLPVNTTDPSLIITPHAKAVKSDLGNGKVSNFEFEL